MKMKKLFTLFSLLLLAVGVNAQETISLGGKTTDDFTFTTGEFTVNEAANGDNGSFNYVKKDNSNYSELKLTGTSVVFQYKNSAEKNNFFRLFDDYFYCNGKGTKIVVKNLLKDQTVTVKACGKNSTGALFTAVDNCEADESNPTAAVAQVTDLADYSEFKFKALADGDIIITENSAGFQIASVTIQDAAATVEPGYYYVVGDMTEWTVNENYRMQLNTEAEGEEYMLNMDLAANAALKVVESVPGSTSQTWFPDGMDNNFTVSVAGNYNVYFRPDGQGGDGWHYGYIYAELVQAAPEAPKEYYLVGNFNEWAVDDNYKLTPDATAEGIYSISIDLNKDDQLKVTDKDKSVWYPSGDNYIVNISGTHTVTLNTTTGELTVSDDEVESVEDGFYLVGSFNNWTASADYKFTENAGQDGEYQLVRISLTAGDELKVVGKSATAGDIWYPGAEAGNYTVKKTGTHSIYFRPDGQGNDDWYCGVFYVDNDEAATGAFNLTSVAENGQVTFYVEGAVAESANAGVAVTANVEAAEGYVLNEETIKVEAYGKFEDAQGPQQAPAIGLLRDVDYTIADDVISFTMPEANVRVTVEFTVDKQELDNLIDDAKELADELEDGDAKTDLGTAITAAEGVMNDPNATPEDVQTAIDNLQDAIDKAKQELEGEEVEVTIAAGAFKTMYLEKKRTVKAAVEGVKLYTVTQVNADEKKAVLSAELEVVDAEKPFIIYNEGTTEATIVLSVATGTPTQVTIAPEFKGTLADKTFTAADLEAADYYTLQGSNFLWAAEAGTIPANRCWIQLDKSAGSPASLSIVFGDDTTGIKSLTPALTEGEGVYYDLSGRRVAQPTKGLYIINGKKVVIK